MRHCFLLILFVIPDLRTLKHRTESHSPRTRSLSQRQDRRLLCC